MTCEELASRLDAWLEGALGRTTLDELEAHLAECPDCVHYATAYRRTITLTRATLRAPEPLPPDLQRALRSLIR